MSYSDTPKNLTLPHLRAAFLRLPLFEQLWVLAPVAVWFSYHPLIRLGQNASMNFELSLSLIYIVLLGLAGIPHIWQERSKLRQNKAVWLIGSLVAVSAFSLIWTPDFLRGILTFGVISCLFVIFLASLAHTKRLIALLPILKSSLVITAVVMSILAITQMFVAVWFDVDITLLCRGCAPSQFGFARPNVFTNEPQFLGSLLLAPALILTHKLLSKYASRQTFIYWLIIVTTLFVTLSRGAIFAFGIAISLLLALELRSVKKLVQMSTALVASILLSLLIQASAAAMHPKLNATFFGTLSTSVNQLSLGLLSLPYGEKDVEPKDTSPSRITPQTTEKPTFFSGYVEESTDVRLKLSRLAIQSWAISSSRMVFGVGLGGSGKVLHNEKPHQVNKREIVQNEYVERLLESGLVGLSLFIGSIGTLLYGLRNNKWLWSVVIAYVVQWNFFSGYPNALHIYLLMVVLAVIVCMNIKSKPVTH